MLGNNKMIINQASMCEIIQHYLDTVLYKDNKQGVSSVCQTGNTEFVVVLQAKDRKGA